MLPKSVIRKNPNISATLIFHRECKVINRHLRIPLYQILSF
ncbi:hypothetical protein LEP1GSC062_2650 [Leptospira alexanderi serovar Manhao 3 str. L 60]|uniref:Uncharacterized protein n=1 Tax=Leptospira alexanderi serovar Manhao 3 str. L 60 TaxID=1049759 RepID=V6HX25_9LEPT|nr:hypothetical protein LEP1GSC062_2650 [Leptospira alexanderi serovar Manhao 3 str. L 60]